MVELLVAVDVVSTTVAVAVHVGTSTVVPVGDDAHADRNVVPAVASANLAPFGHRDGDRLGRAVVVAVIATVVPAAVVVAVVVIATSTVVPATVTMTVTDSDADAAGSDIDSDLGIGGGCCEAEHTADERESNCELSHTVSIYGRIGKIASELASHVRKSRCPGLMAGDVCCDNRDPPRSYANF